MISNLVVGVYHCFSILNRVSSFPPNRPESNPDSINEYLLKLGVDERFAVSDILGFDEEMLGFVVKPVNAVIFLYPLDGENIEQDLSLLSETDEEREAKDLELGEDLYTIKQTISNACGTIALIHALANNLSLFKFKEDSIVKKFIDSTMDKSPIERGLLLEEEKELARAHEECAESGDSAMNMRSNLHFVALVEHKNYLWKVDGRKEKPSIRVNTATSDSVLESAAEYARAFMKKNRYLNQFAAMAFSDYS